ncbi:hypothetical protein SEA_MIEK_76 [Streptomyces phage Miek]|jgi:hypothetical protein|nr:hypothetical protein SEA_SENDITCS_74 [Streptomyces phage SendItCS]WIC89413.1 hypothetical protein SEA_MIEK_76 [Streptomyces phage Miek]
MKNEDFPQIPDVVDKFYAHDPDIEDYVPDCTHLSNGLVVLLGDPDRRASAKDMKQDWGWDRALERNRWCTVTELTWSTGGAMVNFVGVYGDGTKRKRSFLKDEPWLIKLDSIPNAEVESSKRYQDTCKKILAALEKVDEYTCSCYRDSEYPTIEELAEATARSVLGFE